METISNIQETEENTSTELNKPDKDINLYPTIRTVTIAVLVIVFIFLVLFLIYQNGKSIYVNGI
jgi:hypothetical protein